MRLYRTAQIGGHAIKLEYASEAELTFLLDIIKEENCRSFLEIGSKYGRMLLRWAEILPKGARICSIDKPGGAYGDKKSEPILRAVIEHLRREGFDTHLWLGDSHEESTVEWARNLGPFDLVFIDADHTSAAVSMGWGDYSPMAKIVAFHDVSPDVCGGAVSTVYEELCQTRRHKTCVGSSSSPGTGVIWV